MKIFQCLFTRFSLLQPLTRKPLFSRQQSSLLNCDRLETRLDLLEALTFPSIAEQKASNFQWFILVDPELPFNIRKTLESTVHHSEHVDIVTVPPAARLGEWNWLAERVPAGTTHILSTNLDDDDGLGIVEPVVAGIHVIQNMRAAPSRTFAFTLVTTDHLDGAAGGQRRIAAHRQVRGIGRIGGQAGRVVQIRSRHGSRRRDCCVQILPEGAVIHLYGHGGIVSRNG